MKYAIITFAVLFVIAGLFFFTKPSDSHMKEEAMKIVGADLIKVPGYSDANANISLPATPEGDKIVVQDHFLWKDVSYIYPGTVKKLGKGYLGSFHSSGSSNR